MTNPIELAVVIGRFQPFHLGHLALLEHALSAAPRALLVVGSAPGPRVAKNPFTAEERIAAIQSSLTPDQRARVSFAMVRDYYDEPRWAGAVKAKVRAACAGNVALVGFRKDESSSYLSLFPEWTEIDLPRQAPIDGTTLRGLYFGAPASDPVPAELCAAIPAAVAEFLAAFRKTEHFEYIKSELTALERGRAKYGTGPFVTVDAVVTVNDKVLLIQRGHAPGAGLWALPGGFLDGSERLLMGAIRELREETQVELSDQEMKSALRGVAVFDHPQRSQRGRTITHAHYFALPGGVPKAVVGSDDARAARWFPIAELPNLLNELFDDHFQILDHFLHFSHD